MRSILVAITLVLFLILSMPLFLIMKLIGVFNKRASVLGSQAIVTFGFRVILFVAGVRVVARGVENIPKDRPVLFTANHRSYADIPMVYTTAGVPIGFVAKKEIKKFIGLSWWMTNMNCLFIDRADIRQSLKIILKAVDYVKEGYSMFIMPEGTRNHAPEMLPFKEGSFKIAEKSGCPVIPVAISNSDSIYELHRPWVKAAKVVIHYGKPIELENLTKEQLKVLGTIVRDTIDGMLVEDREYWS